VTPTAWRLLLGEVRAGQRRHTGTDLGDHYGSLLAHLGEGDYTPPKLYERTLGDILHPARPGRAVDVVNAASREVGTDVAGWRFERVLSMHAAIDAEAAQRPEV